MRVAGFPRLALSYAVNELGDNLGVVALAILVLDGTDSALATAGLFVCARFLPALAAPWLTARLDRRAVNRSLPALYVLEALAFAGLALIAGGTFALAAVLVLAFADGTLALTGRGISRAAVAALLLPHRALREGNALLNAAFAIASAAGPAAAGILVGTAGAAAALWVDAASFALIAALLFVARDLRRRPPRRRAGPGGPGACGRASPRCAASRSARSSPPRRSRSSSSSSSSPSRWSTRRRRWTPGTSATACCSPRGAPGSSSGRRSSPACASGRPARSWSARPAGRRRLPRTGRRPGIVLACVASVVGGTGNGVQWVSVLTAVQEALPEELQARVVGLLESVAAAAPGAGFLAGGVLTALWSPRLAYLVAGAGVIAVAVAMAHRIAPAARSG